jgi:molybdopterin synthase catalytic subunit/molybdopterin converting factor small subunit
MRVRVLFFGMLKDVVGHAGEDSEVAEGASLATLFEDYAVRYPRLREIGRSIVIARNREFAGPATLLEDGDEVAFLPPVSGGAAAAPSETSPSDPIELTDNGNYFAITRHCIDDRTVRDRLIDGSDGAVVTFEGTVRNSTKGRRTRCLDYECYEPMALKVMAKIGVEIAAEFPIHRIAMVHRLGRLLIGEASVVVIVTAAHRRPAFDAALEGINRLKKLVPIWKKEHFVDGEVWVEGEWDRDVPVAG